jgi:DNA replication protein DnaC
MDAVVLDELGYLPFSQAGGALLFHLLSRLYEHTSVIITTNPDFAEWSASTPGSKFGRHGGSKFSRRRHTKAKSAHSCNQ